MFNQPQTSVVVLGSVRANTAVPLGLSQFPVVPVHGCNGKQAIDR